MSRLLACIDFSNYTNSVCDHAAWAAKRLMTPIELIHVLDRREIDPVSRNRSGVLGLGDHETLLAEMAEVDELRHRLARQQGQLVLSRAEERLRGAGIKDVRIHQRYGTVVETVAELVPGAAMLVIGKRGESAEHAGDHLGSNLERIARSIHTPTLVVSTEFKRIERALVAFDGGPSAQKAVDHLVSTPILRETQCHLLTIGSPDDTTKRERGMEAASRLSSAGVPTTFAMSQGDPDQVIIDKIGVLQANLLVIGAYGHSRIRDLIIGSTTTALLRSSPVPVLMYR